MKKILILTFLMGSFCFGLTAQDRSIGFEESKEWKKIVRKAKKEKKLIFVDCYTSWCGPCKMLADKVFTQNAVADYFNNTFVNAKFDMEKDKDGVILKDQFGVKAFPTLVFVDPATQQVVHTLVGAGTAEWLIEGGKTANDPLNNFSGLKKRYESGDRNPEFLEKYLHALGAAYLKEEQGAVAVEYLNTLSPEQLITKENWELIKANINDPLSQPLREVMANRSKFYAVAGKEVVDHKLTQAIRGATYTMAGWRPEQGDFDEKKWNELVQYLKTVDFDAAPSALAVLYSVRHVANNDYKGLLNSMRTAFEYNIFRGGEDRLYFQMNIERLMDSNDKALVEEGVKWIDLRCADIEDYFEKANLMNSKARLLISIGDTLGADKAKLDEEKFNAEGEKRSGGRAVRAIRMN